MTRDVYVLEEYSDGEGWYPVRSAETRYEVECIHARWPDTKANPKRIVRYVPAPPQEETQRTCVFCLTYHSEDTMCPPHEMR